jgi:hypothetical protein
VLHEHDAADVRWQGGNNRVVTIPGSLREEVVEIEIVDAFDAVRPTETATASHTTAFETRASILEDVHSFFPRRSSLCSSPARPFQPTTHRLTGAKTFD